jgi:formamidopyrimidine-DNA glycosylase
MPELPEVEVITRGLRPHIIGKKIIGLWHSGKDLRVAVPVAQLQEGLVGATVMEVSRRAKYIKFDLDSGAMMVIHLGMTGNLGIFTPSQKRKMHDHLEWRLAGGTLLRLHDIRRFGAIYFLGATSLPEAEHALFRTTGPEPFSSSFSADALYRLAKERKLTVKQFIMTNQVVAGIGNIYANESLFMAGIRPSKRVSRLSKKNWENLIRCIRAVLTHAIDCGGSTISDFRSASQQTGYFQVNFKVYGRNGSPCPNCSTTIKREILGGRASFYCPSCQK